ncbi:metal-dependent transcriptional regulator [Brooklawnia cerclae]|uniref:DtxR family Mn-dependent transcriptional regulator n=1 Tax=Brooklawnia cerclae TaxID=349934 RepID=A0ABX0SHX8_9ACTN|nr:metal-dependent transcriptional regulator [Brooklawnia cerclae]NIH58010.1 DtxR family Mn-dependent transcriptional regulator [Brooklawnia cerclae]
MSELIDTTEMYLRTILELHEEGIEPLRARIVERLHQSGPTVSQTVARLERDGLLWVRDDRRIELSELGWHRANSVMRKHRLAECMLSDIIGMEWVDVHEEACKLEHVISDLMEERLAVLLDEPALSPYGCPVPRPEGSPPADFRKGVLPLDDVLGDKPLTVTLRRFSEQVQADAPALTGLDDVGLRPGVEFEAVRVGDALEIRTSEGRVRVDGGLASGLWIDPIDS